MLNRDDIARFVHINQTLEQVGIGLVADCQEEALHRQGTGGKGSAGAVDIRFRLMLTASIRSLSVNETLVAVGTSEGAVYLCDHGRKVLLHHADLGGRVDSILLSARGIQTAFCYPRLFRFDEGAPRSSEAITDYSVQLVACGEGHD